MAGSAYHRKDSVYRKKMVVQIEADLCNWFDLYCRKKKLWKNRVVEDLIKELKEREDPDG